MPDYNLPAEGASVGIMPQHLTPVDPNIPMGVKPFPIIDPMKNAAQAYSLAEGIGEYNQAQTARDTEASDTAILKAAQASGINMASPEGMDQLIKEVGPQLSPKGMQDLIKRKSDLTASTDTAKIKLAALDERQLNQQKEQLAELGRDMAGPVTAYQDALSSGKSTEEAAAAFEAAKAAALEMRKNDIDPVTKQPRIPPERLAAMAQWTPEQWSHSRDVISHQSAVTKAALDLKKEQASVNRTETQTEIMKQGKEGLALSTLQDKLDAGEITQESFDEQKKMLLSKGAGSAAAKLQGVPESQIGDKERSLAVGQWIQNPSSLRGLDKTYQQNVIKWAASMGITAEDVASGQAQRKFDLAAAVTSGHRAGSMVSVEATIPRLIANAREASAKVDRGSFVPWNQLMQYGDAKLSDPNLKALKIANQGIASEYQQVISRGGSNVTALNEAMHLLQTAESKEAYEAALAMVEKEVKANVQGSEAVREKLTPKHGPGSDAKSGQLEIMNQELVKAQKEAATATDPSAKARAQSDIEGIQREIKALGGSVTTKEGATSVSKSGKPMVFKNGAWVYSTSEWDDNTPLPDMKW
jgi:hypothetical protein